MSGPERVVGVARDAVPVGPYYIGPPPVDDDPPVVGIPQYVTDRFPAETVDSESEGE